MPQVDYSKCVIYKIQHKEKDELLYVGSTTHFRNRKVKHKSSCYNPNEKIYNNKLYSTIRTNGGWDAFSMVMVKPFPCENKRQADAEEDRIMREMRSSLNTNRAYQTPEGKKELMKEYREQNRDKVNDRKKQYYNENRVKILEEQKLYRELNPDKKKEEKKRYYLNNIDKIKEKIKEKVLCECGCIITKGHLTKHLKTLKHQTFINQQTEQ